MGILVFFICMVTEKKRKKMRYSIEVVRVTSSNGDFEVLYEFFNVKRKIINYLMKNKYVFSVGIYAYDERDYVASIKNFKAHIIIYSKNDIFLNEILRLKLKKLKGKEINNGKLTK